MAKFDMRAYAIQGARSRAGELESELSEIYRAFPELRTERGGRTVAKSVSPVRRRRRNMTAAERNAVSARMKKYWAARRKSAKSKD